MKKYRFLSVLMVVMLVVASIPTLVVHADTIGREAQACKALGILLGSDDGVTSQYLAANPTRLQAYIIALRLKGLYNEAGYFTSKNNFTDVVSAGWAKNYLAYAKNTPSLGWTGYPDGRFGVNDKMSAQAFYKVMLETLGYKQNIDFTYADTLPFAAKIGLVEDANQIAALKSFTINDIAKGIYRALNTGFAGTDKKLATVLIEKGIFDAKKVEAAGLYTSLQISTIIDNNYSIAWVPIKETYEKMGCYIIEDKKGGVSYEIRKNNVNVRLTEMSAFAFMNGAKVTLEKPIMKGADGVFYAPVSFVMKSAQDLGYAGKYYAIRKVLELQESDIIKAAQSELVIAKGSKKTIKVGKVFSGVLMEDVTGQCTYTLVSNSGIVFLGGTPGELIGANIGSAEIVVSYRGNEVDRVTAYVVDVVPKYYPVAAYEQVFDTTFRMDKPNYTDGYGVVWNKQTGVITKINEDDSFDTGSSLNMLNYSEAGMGLNINLSKLLENRAIKGKTCTLKIFAKGVSEGAALYVKASSKSKYELVSKENTVVLNEKWKGIELLKIDIPADATEFNISISTGKNQEVRIDAFTLTSN